MIGTTLHHYRIVRPLGRGGMGEVYAAEDTKLHRTVALKLLPQITAAGPDQLKRFQREAQAIAALNHPNVVTIYSVEEAGGVPFITMELVEGKPLDALIPRRGMKLAALLALARPLTDAISAAHQRGIVHRDLKPSNIMVGDDGRLKVLDFGLAKLTQETIGDEGMAAANTATVEELTARHDIIGTAAYMSPEQAEGHAVDHRSDIFSIGILLYEMATGTRPFKGESAISILSSIIKDVPAAASQINAGVPPELERIIRRCLAKDPARRYQSALDLRNDLEEVGDQSGAVMRGPAFLLAARRLRWIVALVAIGLVGAAAATLWREPGAGRVAVTFNKLTALPGREWFPSLSPDGKWLVYGGENAGNLDIYLQSVSGSNPVNLTQDSAADDDMPAFSPDGEHIVFRSGREDGGLFVMGRTGEAVRRVTRTGFNPAWSPDGGQIAFATVRMDVNPQNQEGMSELWVVGADGAEARRLHPGDALQPSWSPHKRRIAFAARRLGAARGADVWTIPVDGGPASAVTTDPSFDWNPIWSPDGQHLYFASDRSGTMNLWRIAIDEETGEPRGQPEPITTPAGFIAHPSISADGRRLAYSAVLMVTNIQRLAFDPAAAAVNGEPIWITTGSRLWSNPDPSPDGQSVAFYSRVEPEGDLYVSRTDGTGQRQLTSDAALDRMPRWSPDGQWITCFSDRSGKLQIWKIRPDGSDLQQITGDADPVAYGTWSPDGSRLAVASVVGTLSANEGFSVIDPNKKWTEQQPDRLPPVPDSSQQSFTPNSWSLDGERLVGQLGLTPGVLTYTFKSRSYERLTVFGEWPVWLPDSRRVLFGDGGKNFWVLDVQTRQAKAIYSAGRDVLGPPRLTPDGRTAYYSRRVTESDIWLMTLK